MDAKQIFEQKNEVIISRFLEAKNADPARFERSIDLSWSVWMFGIEPFGDSLDRLKRNGLGFVEITGNHFTKDSGLNVESLHDELHARNMRISGMCGMYTPENDLSSNSAYVRQNAIDYIRREVDVLTKLDGKYLIVVPSAVGRPNPIDSSEFMRSSVALARCGDDFEDAGVCAAIEPIRSAEVSLVHSISDARAYLEAVDHPGVGHINGDIYHMSLEEAHIGEAILEAGDRLVNLHLADTNRDALGRGMINLDIVIMAAYLAGMNQEGRFLTPEPLGPYPDPYVLANSLCQTEVMDRLVEQTVHYFRAREKVVRSL
jgi:sugar phosphate isomerase/epimerase